MSKRGRVLFIFGIVAFFVLFLARFIYGGWHDSFWVPFVLMAAFLAAGLYTDRKAIVETLSLRSTKHGMNMGALILVAVAGIVCVNVFAIRYEKKFDWTSDQFNSLSEQSVSAVKSLKADTEILLLYRKDDPQTVNIERNFGTLTDMYRRHSDRLKFSSFNALARPDLAQKYEYSQGPFVMYAVQGEKKQKIDPVTEESITRALIKFNRDKKKTIYFTRGHGELMLDEKEAAGLSIMRDELNVTFDLKQLAIFESGNKIPADADAVAIIGPRAQFQEAELKALRDYARSGGHLFIGIDPGMHHGLALLTKTLGVEFNNDYVLDQSVMKNAPTLVLGVGFSGASDITKAIATGGNAVTVFEGASTLKKAPDADKGLAIEELVLSGKATATVPELKEQIVYRENGPHIIAMTVQGQLPSETGRGAAEPAKPFSAVIFGDADFASNRLFQNNSNRDLVGNSFAWLASDTDLITVRPREPKGTVLNMPAGSYNAWAAMMLFIPMALFISGFTVWFRRRVA